MVLPAGAATKPFVAQPLWLPRRHSCRRLRLLQKSPVSERHVQAELDLARRLVTGNGAEASADGRARVVEVDVVEGVERVGPEFDLDALGRGELLAQAHVPNFPSGAQHAADAGVAQPGGWRSREDGGVEPLVGAALVAGQRCVAAQVEGAPVLGGIRGGAVYR